MGTVRHPVCWIVAGSNGVDREQDIHRIVDVFTSETGIPRYIDSSEPEDLHDLEARLRGGIPDRDIEALEDYWSVFLDLRYSLVLDSERNGYSSLQTPSGKLRDDEGYFAELDVLHDWVRMANGESKRKNVASTASKSLNERALEKYAALEDVEIKQLVVEDKWFASLRKAVNEVLHDTGGRLATRLRELDERYARPLPDLQRDVNTFEAKVEEHLRKMGVSA